MVPRTHAKGKDRTLNADFRRYKILGAFNPPFVYQALQAEDKIGTMLPWNVIVQETTERVEVAAVDPIASMAAVKIPKLAAVAEQVQVRLKKIIETL